MVRFIALLIASLVVAITALADEGHHHDELSGQQLGTVHFPVSCAPGVQKTFERGVALLHSFAFDTAEATFRQVAEEDPHCAMAYWGIAKTFDRNISEEWNDSIRSTPMITKQQHFMHLH